MAGKTCHLVGETRTYLMSLLTVCGVQVPVSSVDENSVLPSHAMHAVSSLLLPATKPKPDGQSELLCGLHGVASLEAENLPAAHFAHEASFVVVEVTSSCPAPHVVTVADLHGDVDRPGLKDSPEIHFSQPVFRRFVPCTNPRPSPQFKLECGAHLINWAVMPWKKPAMQLGQLISVRAVPFK
jgi:hypothetical protein